MESVMKRTTATGFLSTCAISLALFSSCTSVEPNTLTPEEIADGWQLLFDGKTLNGWKDYNGTTLTQPWHVVDGCIQAKGDGSDASGYIVTDKQYENFELSWDWKLSKGGNSGMLYHVVERPQFAVPYVTGPEYQLIDEPNFPEPLEEWQKLGVDYAMHLPDKAKMKVNPQGEWNNSKIVFDNGHVEHWLNGIKVVEYERNNQLTIGMQRRTAVNGQTPQNTAWPRKVSFACKTTDTLLLSVTSRSKNSPARQKK